MTAPSRFEFTRHRVDAATCPDDKTQALFWDTKQPGLGLRVTSGGKRTFIFEAKLGRQTIRMTIGYASMPIRVPKDRKGNPTGPGADGEALRLMSLIKAGTDPRVEKAALMAQAEATREAVRKERQRQQLTGLNVWSIYCTARAPMWGQWSVRDHTQVVRAPHGALHNLLSGSLASIDASSIEAWLRIEVATRPGVAVKAFRMLRAYLRWASEQPEYSHIVQADAHAPRRIREMLPTLKPRSDSLQREMLADWFMAVRKLDNPIIRTYLQALLLTGARREELTRLKWSDVIFEHGGSLTIGDKVDGTRRIPLTPYLGSLLINLPRHNEYVFSSTKAASGYIQEPSYAHKNALEAAGLPHITLHGLRRSFGTLVEWVNLPVGVSAQIMGHKPSAIAEKHYRQRPLDMLRMWHNQAEAWILQQAGIDHPDAASHLATRSTEPHATA